MTAVIKRTHLKFNGKKYFRTGSEDVALGSHGEKKIRAGQGYLFVEGDLDPKVMRLRAKQATIVEIDFKRSRKTAFAAKAAAPIKGVGVEAGLAVMYDSLRQGTLKLVKFRVLPSDLEDVINANAKVRGKMKRDGARARVANEIFVVMEAKLAKKITSGVNGKLSGKAGKVSVKVEGKSSASSTTTVTISKGTTFAYLLLRPEWDRVAKAKRRRIVDWDDDQVGAT